MTLGWAIWVTQGWKLSSQWQHLTLKGITYQEVFKMEGRWISRVMFAKVGSGNVHRNFFQKGSDFKWITTRIRCNAVLAKLACQEIWIMSAGVGCLLRCNGGESAPVLRIAWTWYFTYTTTYTIITVLIIVLRYQSIRLWYEITLLYFKVLFE